MIQSHILHSLCILEWLWYQYYYQKIFNFLYKIESKHQRWQVGSTKKKLPDSSLMIAKAEKKIWSTAIWTLLEIIFYKIKIYHVIRVNNYLHKLFQNFWLKENIYTSWSYVFNWSKVSIWDVQNYPFYFMFLFFME